MFFSVQFKVESVGHMHTGPFIIIGGSSANIILPLNFPKPVEKDNRELVQIINLQDSEYDIFEKALYGFIESGSAGLVDSFLGNDYKKIHRITGANATLEKLKEKLTLAGSAAGTKAVDLVFCTHGHTNSVVFAGGANKITTVERILKEIPENIRKKFRMVFSTACFGETHLNSWINIGFSCASGSEGIYADSEVSGAPFLSAWEKSKTFTEAIASANSADIGNVADGLAIAYYNSIGKIDDAGKINSNRIVAGNGDLRIYSSPE